MRAASFMLVVLLVACEGSAPSARTDEQTTHPDAPPIAPFTECTVYTAREGAPGFTHVAACSELDFTTYPPVGGPHYGSWAAFQTYTAPVPWGFLMHSMEHGAVVIAYRCDEACPELVAELQALIDERPADPLCNGRARPTRMILVPDPDLEQPIAAVAWERMYSATCLDAPSLRAFIDEAYGHGREDLCHAGVDLSASGWCPAP